MSIELNHTIVHARDPHASATFLSEMLGRSAPVRFGPFWDVELDNHLTLAFIRADEHLTIEHYAFLVSEEEFDRIFERIKARALPYWADPAHQQPGNINHHDGGRGVYWNDPDGHYLEIITRPYGSVGDERGDVHVHRELRARPAADDGRPSVRRASPCTRRRPGVSKSVTHALPAALQAYDRA